MIYSSELMRNLMMDLLDLAQMENNTFKLNKGHFSLPEIINLELMFSKGTLFKKLFDSF
jgi:signal transduction histidine kinase